MKHRLPLFICLAALLIGMSANSGAAPTFWLMWILVWLALSIPAYKYAERRK